MSRSLNRTVGEPDPILVSDGRTSGYAYIPSSKKELTLDTVMSLDAAGANFHDLGDMVPGTFQINHLNRRIPAGGNIVFLDGHVAWRHFDEMRVRASEMVHFWW